MRNIEFTEYKGICYKGITLDGSVIGVDYSIYLLESTIAPALMPKYPDNYDYAHEKFDELGFTSWLAMEDALFSVIKEERKKEEAKWREEIKARRILEALS